MTKTDAAKIQVEIDPDVLAKAFNKAMSVAPSAFTRNPIATAIVKAIEEDTALPNKVRKIVADFLAGPEIERRVRSVLRDAMLGEAERLGRQAARAIVNAKELDQ